MGEEEQGAEFIPSPERAGGKVTVYTEVTPIRKGRAREIQRGIFESQQAPKLNPNRWFAETVLDYFQPPELKAKGINRRQIIFASPSPYQDSRPIRGRVLLALDVDPSTIYVAEADFVTEIILHGSIARVLKLKRLVGEAEGGITREEFEKRFNLAPQQIRDELIADAQEPAEKYWASVIPYADYISQSIKYEEPEILMTPATEIQNIRKVDG